jgi:hypothetical protein
VPLLHQQLSQHLPGGQSGQLRSGSGQGVRKKLASYSFKKQFSTGKYIYLPNFDTGERIFMVDNNFCEKHYSRRLLIQPTRKELSNYI